MREQAKYRLECGDVLTVEWDGNVWVAPSCGAQYAHVADAMRVEVEAYLLAGGDDAPVTEDGDVDLAAAGEWVEEDDETATILDAIATSISEDRSVAVHVSLNIVIEVLSETEYEYSHATENDGSVDVWGWTEDTPEGEHVWRLNVVEQSDGTGS